MISFYEWEAKMFSTGKEEKENKCDACIPFDSSKHIYASVIYWNFRGRLESENPI